MGCGPSRQAAGGEPQVPTYKGNAAQLAISTNGDGKLNASAWLANDMDYLDGTIRSRRSDNRSVEHGRTSIEAQYIQAVKTKLQKEWVPEYEPEELQPPQDSSDVHSERSTNVTLSMILKNEEELARKTKIICTAGPACWSEAGLAAILDAGCNVLRLNFSHGDHEGHLAVLDRFRQVCAAKSANAACLLDTKGPEIRTAMLRGHESVELTAGQSILIEAVGDAYTTYEGYKDEQETRIGLSYDKLCSSVKPGNKILLADGSISITVEEVLNARTLRGTVLNSKALGERKNCNLPGVKVDIPVLTEKDIGDLQSFAAKHGMDFVAASFVQSGADVRFIRKVLNEAPGGERVKIISKIENLEGLVNYDEILEESDGIMVARGDLGMEIPSEKVPVAQKMMITKANIAGKFVITATQMLESMIDSPRPTRAEMTDVANAVYDGTDAVMLSGETANGSFPGLAVSTMAAIVANAEVGVDYYSQINFIRYWSTKGNSLVMSPAESMLSSAALLSVGFTEDTTPEALKSNHRSREAQSIIVCLTSSGHSANLIAKFRPPSLVVVAASDAHVLRQCSVSFGQVPLKVDTVDMASEPLADMAVAELIARGLLAKGRDVRVVVARGHAGGCADTNPVVTVIKVGGHTLKKKGFSTGNMLYSPSGVPIQRPGVRSLRPTLTNLPLITAPVKSHRSTKVVCTMGPSCWSEEVMGGLLDAGMDIVRLNFSHGDHEAHLSVLQRFRKVCATKQADIQSRHGLQSVPHWGCLLDTKGPEIRTAMLRGHKSIELTAGQTILIEAVGEAYTTYEGYKDEQETRIGLSYDKLCSSVTSGNKILLADGSLSITVEEVLSPTLLRGTVLNSKALGERKNCNLPGVKVDIPVLTEKDIGDLQNFAAKHGMDFVAASFVQSGADVRFIRKVLDDAPNGCGERVKIISKIENAEGLLNYDQILAESDGIMVARGDLGMEIAAEKVPLAQKMMITKANIAGKFVITATQMLESMIGNPRPTRAEMTDVANAVLDGTDAVMLSGETANGSFPALAVQTISAICQNAECMVDVNKRYNFLRNHTPKPMSGAESVCSGAVQTAIDTGAKAIICVTTSGRAPSLVSKYRPPVPVFVVTPDPQLVKHCQSMYGQIGVLVSTLNPDLRAIVAGVVEYAKQLGVLQAVDGDDLVILQRRKALPGSVSLDDQRLVMRTLRVGSGIGGSDVKHTAYPGNKVLFHRSTKIGLDTILDPERFKFVVRKTKIICTAGPACWSEAGLAAILDAGCNVLRLNFSHGDHEAHLGVLKRFRKVCKDKGLHAASLLDTKGPEIRTAMLRGHKSIELTAGQTILIEAVGEAYTTYEGYKDEQETKIGLSYAQLCSSVKPGNKILLADGSISITVEEVLSPSLLRGTVLNSKALGERKNCNLPGVKVDIPVLTEKDIGDLQIFCAKHEMDFVAASFVQSAADVRFIRRKLDEAGGQDVRIISKIENAEGLQNFDEILEVTDGVMVARGDLGMEIPVEKVPLAQKLMITKANIAGKFVICATQMLESMISNPMPTRAEMTDVANAVFDGVDAVMLSGETANGEFPALAVQTMAHISRSAEIGVNFYQSFQYIRTFTPKPVCAIEAIVSSVAKSAVDIRPGMIVVFSEGGKVARLLSKYRPCAPVLVVTSNAKLARYCSALFAMTALLLPKPMKNVSEMSQRVAEALQYGVAKGICVAGKEVVVLTSSMVARGADDVVDDCGTLPEREVFVTLAPGQLSAESLGVLAPHSSAQDPRSFAKTISLRSTIIDAQMLMQPSSLVRKTKVCVTLGPSSDSDAIITQLVDGGMNVARFNLSHSTTAWHVDVLARLRRIAAAKGRSVAIMLDLNGPELRTSYLVDPVSRQRIPSIQIAAGDVVTLYGCEDQSPETFVGWKQGTDVRLGTSLPDLADVVKVGCVARLMDGIISIEVRKVAANGSVTAVALNGGVLGERKVLTLTGVSLHLPVTSERDLVDIQEFGIKHAVDYIAVSQVRGGGDVLDVRAFLDDNGGNSIKIVSKIETAESLRSVDDILEASDGLLIARGNLGVVIGPEKVALAQALVTTKANVAGKPVIIARQMLESMISNPRPTRAEMTDVANAVLDGAHCIVLSTETATGAFPVASLQTACDIARNAEAAVNYVSIGSFIRDFSAKPFFTVEAAALALSHACSDAQLGLCIVISDSGEAANLVTKYKPPVPQLVISSQPPVVQQCELMFGQVGYLVDPEQIHAITLTGVDALLAKALTWAHSKKIVAAGARVGVMHGSKAVDTCSTAMIKILGP